jgi:hypothetical protein
MLESSGSRSPTKRGYPLMMPWTAGLAALLQHVRISRLLTWSFSCLKAAAMGLKIPVCAYWHHRGNAALMSASIPWVSHPFRAS